MRNEPGKPQIIFPVERLDLKNLQISAENYHERKRFATIRMEAVMEYITSNEILPQPDAVKIFWRDRCDPLRAL